jgi:hypothetical protein
MPLVRPDAEPLEAPLSEATAAPARSTRHLPRATWCVWRGGRNQTEAEFIQALLLEWGVPSVLRRTAGFDVPDFLAAGPRDILVPGVRRRDRSRGAAPGGPGPATSAASRPGPRPLVLAAVIGFGGAAAALLAWLLQG